MTPLEKYTVERIHGDLMRARDFLRMAWAGGNDKLKQTQDWVEATSLLNNVQDGLSALCGENDE
jgi:hypothetical protein